MTYFFLLWKEIIAKYVYNNNYSFSILSWKRFVHFLLLYFATISKFALSSEPWN